VRGLLVGLAVGAGIVLLRPWGEDRIRDLVREPESPHAKYADALRDAGLEGTTVGRGWLAAADSALLHPVDVALPHREAGYFGADETPAVAFRWRVARGRRVVVELDTAARGALLFVDLFVLSADSIARPDRVASLEDSSGRIEYEPRRDETLVLRLQPEMLGAVRWTLTVRSDPTLAFPVAGRDLRAALSRFGASRDAGARRHEGIDIFAPRGTPVVASAPGTVSGRTRNTLGGNVVWLRADGGAGLYYAHLDRQLVSPGERVDVGDTLGLVGNTGNARGTPPHLHFGVYARRAVDPVPYLEPSPPVPPVRADGDALGARVRLARAASLEAGPTSGRSARHPLAAGTVMRVVGASRDAYRVRLADGTPGYVPSAATAAATSPLREVRVEAGRTIVDRPAGGALVVDSIAAATSLPVLGTLDGALMLRLPSGRTGWLRPGPGATAATAPAPVARDARGGAT
jgi:peptidoglycan LD-endopeptidase LytH